jgi:RND family efflux transporter MFP subunit
METQINQQKPCLLPDRPPKKFHWKLPVFGVVTVSALIFFLASKSGKATPIAAAETPPPVAVVKVTREDLARDIKIPAEFRPYEEVELHAKVSGYLEKMNVDFGDHVQAGQLLATIEIPELQDELDSATAAEQKAEADHKNAHLVYSRLLSVNKDHPNLVAQEDLDTAESRDAQTAAALTGAKADVGKYQTLVSYTKITAPFDGVITHRYADPGAMIQAGTSSQASPLLRISDNYRLRLDFQVSVDDVKDVRVGDSVDVRIESLGGKTLAGKVSRFTQRVDATTRTMVVESEVENPQLELVPGMYATVQLKASLRPNAIAIPIEAITPGKATVLVVNANDELEERTVSLGLETPTKYEVLSGLKEGELVLIGNPGQMKPGQRVEPKITGLLAAQ